MFLDYHHFDFLTTYMKYNLSAKVRTKRYICRNTRCIGYVSASFISCALHTPAVIRNDLRLYRVIKKLFVVIVWDIYFKSTLKIRLNVSKILSSRRHIIFKQNDIITNTSTKVYSKPFLNLHTTK